MTRRGRPEAVGRTSGERHRRDVRDEVGVDDPGGAPQLRPAGEVEEDPGQGDRGDEELDPDEQHPEAEGGQHDGPG